MSTTTKPATVIQLKRVLKTLSTVQNHEPKETAFSHIVRVIPALYQALHTSQEPLVIVTNVSQVALQCLRLLSDVDCFRYVALFDQERTQEESLEGLFYTLAPLYRLDPPTTFELTRVLQYCVYLCNTYEYDALSVVEATCNAYVKQVRRDRAREE